MKSKNILSKILLLSLSFLILNCDDNSPLSLAFSPPKCSITNIGYDDYRPGHFARMTLTVRNNSDPIAFSVGCAIKLKIGNTIIERGGAYFGTLEPGEAAISYSIFSEIDMHCDYEYAEIILYWYDANDEYYEKVYYE